MLARLLFILALLLPVPAAAQSLEDQTLQGSWALRLDGATIFRFDIAPADKPGEWRGTWSRPGSFASDGDHFQKLKGPPKQIASMAGLEFDGEVELSFNDPRPGAIPDIFRFKLVGADTVRMTYVGTGLEPYVLERVEPGAPLGPWDSAKTYARVRLPEKREEAPPPPPKAADEFRLPPGGVQGR